MEALETVTVDNRSLKFEPRDLAGYQDTLKAYFLTVSRNYIDFQKWEMRNDRTKHPEIFQRPDVSAERQRVGEDSLMLLVERVRDVDLARLYFKEKEPRMKMELGEHLFEKINRDFDALKNENEFQAAMKAYQEEFKGTNKREFDSNSKFDKISAWKDVIVPIFQARLAKELLVETQKANGEFYQKIQPPHFYNVLSEVTQMSDPLQIPIVSSSTYRPGEFSTPLGKIDAPGGSGKTNSKVGIVPPLVGSALLVASATALFIESRELWLHGTNEKDARVNLLKALESYVAANVEGEAKTQKSRIEATAQQYAGNKINDAKTLAETIKEKGTTSSVVQQEFANVQGANLYNILISVENAKDKFEASYGANRDRNPRQALKDQIRLGVVNEVLKNSYMNRENTGQ